MNLVSYGLDIGNKSFAWCRIDQQGNITAHSSPDSKYKEKFEQLKQALQNDLQTGVAIAIGVDAPMWSINEFKPRFDQEAPNLQWYNRSGAAATAMSWVYLPDILKLIYNSKYYIYTSLFLPHPPKKPSVYLYEGFMAGQYKISKMFSSLKGINRDKVDAFAVAAASWITITHQQPLSNTNPYNSIILPAPIKIIILQYNVVCFSIWHSMGYLIGSKILDNPQSPCDVFYYPNQTNTAMLTLTDGR
ncbi:hypothetical protein [Sulfoacidibacillus ferrooxidans]|uniref:Uncharacterized protein n=1 Tax=Sulfoacidibacillus ferrooxidans TaxID=2005001 RepID=A0A9X1VBC1_9BACL|nr:hypothetical protein [Sulfoacidibacillus ferrooxidans]MCI0184562.1 hypothetical protein [Sulfoacidibacillus ferrooxidans]